MRHPVWPPKIEVPVPERDREGVAKRRSFIGDRGMVRRAASLSSNEALESISRIARAADRAASQLGVESERREFGRM